MSIISSLMNGNLISMQETDSSRYVKETLAMRDMEKATRIDQIRDVAKLTKKTADARSLAAMRAAKTENVTYDKSGKASPSAHEMAVGLVQAHTAATEAAAAAKDDGQPSIEGLGSISRVV